MDINKQSSNDDVLWGIPAIFSHAVHSLTNLYNQNILFTSEVDKELTELHYYLSNIIKSAKNEANKVNKPLMILIGEDHWSMNSLMIESLIIDIAISKLSINEVLTESQIKGLYDTFMASGEGTVPSLFIQKKLNSMGIKKTPIDIAPSFWKRVHPICLPLAIFDLVGRNTLGIESGLLSEMEYRISKKGIQDRNTYMTATSIKTELSDKIAIVGAAHLFGLLKETNLSEHYYVLPINTCGHYELSLDLVEECKFYEQSEEVVQVLAKSLDKTWVPSFMTYGTLQERLHTLHEKQLTAEREKVCMI